MANSWGRWISRSSRIRILPAPLPLYYDVGVQSVREFAGGHCMSGSLAETRQWTLRSSIRTSSSGVYRTVTPLDQQTQIRSEARGRVHDASATRVLQPPRSARVPLLPSLSPTPLSPIPNLPIMESDMDALLAQAAGGRGGGEITVPDKYVLPLSRGKRCSSSPVCSGEVIHISSLALLKVCYLDCSRSSLVNAWPPSRC